MKELPVELIATITNTILLILIFWYQKNKNKVLEERIEKQSDLLRETKDVVVQQAQAIDSQKKVVDKALEYSKTFDVGKLETVIKREVELEYRQRLREREEEYNKNVEDMKALTAEQVKEMMASFSMQAAVQVAEQFVAPLVAELVILLAGKNKVEREEVLARIPSSLVKTLSSVLEALDERAR